MLSVRPRHFTILCLACGTVRLTGVTDTGRLDSPECPACGYLGWREHEHRPAAEFRTALGWPAGDPG